MERVKGIEPSLQAWEARVLPLNHTRAKRQVTDYHDAGRHATNRFNRESGHRETAGRFRSGRNRRWQAHTAHESSCTFGRVTSIWWSAMLAVANSTLRSPGCEPTASNEHRHSALSHLFLPLSLSFLSLFLSDLCELLFNPSGSYLSPAPLLRFSITVSRLKLPAFMIS